VIRISLATGQVVTSITLDHTLYQQNLNTNFQPNTFLSTPQPTVPVYTSTLHTPLTQRPITSSDEIDKNPFLRPPPVEQSSECGISGSPTIYNSLSSNEMKTSRGQWPWLVAIFHLGTEYVFQCLGSILTKKHVITGVFEEIHLLEIVHLLEIYRILKIWIFISKKFGLLLIRYCWEMLYSCLSVFIEKCCIRVCL